MDNDIEFGNIDVKYYLSCVSETPLWNSGEFRGYLLPSSGSKVTRLIDQFEIGSPKHQNPRLVVNFAPYPSDDGASSYPFDRSIRIAAGVVAELT